MRNHDNLIKVLNRKIAYPINGIHNIIQLIEIMDKRNECRSYRMLFKGFILHHEETCQNPSCPLKNIQNQYIQHYTQLDDDMDITEENNSFILYINHLFKSYLIK